MTVVFSIPASVTPDSSGLRAVSYEVDYALTSDADTLASGTARFTCDPLGATDVEVVESGGARAHGLVSQNFPNPFRGTTAIPYSIRETADVSLSVFDVTGRLVRRLVTGRHGPRDYVVHWDGRDDLGRLVGSGVYFYEVRAGESREARRMVRLK